MTKKLILIMGLIFALLLVPKAYATDENQGVMAQLQELKAALTTAIADIDALKAENAELKRAVATLEQEVEEVNNASAKAGEMVEVTIKSLWKGYFGGYEVMPNITFQVVDSKGEEYRVTTDEKGVATVEVAPGQCQFTAVDLEKGKGRTISEHVIGGIPAINYTLWER